MARHHRRSLRRRITDLVDTLLGRTRPRRANLDQLFALPSAAITLRVATGLRPTGHASVAFRPAEGEAFATVQQEILDLLNTGSGPTTEVQRDEYGYTWLVVRSPPAKKEEDSPAWSPTCTRSTPAWKAPGSGRPCCARS